MNKPELVELIKEVLVLKTKKESEDFIDKFDVVVEGLIERLEADKKVKMGTYVTFEKKKVEAKTGEMTRVVDGVKVKTPYESPARVELVVKRTEALKSI